jgi:hypothetical protein
MPWLTPDDIPEDDTCRPLSIPSSSVWLALVSGALTELTLKYNWQQFGALTVDETVAKMQEIVEGYYGDPCSHCETPGGYRVTRINTEGHFQELDENGDWTDPTGDYYIPPPDARTEGTEPDQICLAAKNAVNVLQQLYESLSDSYSAALSDAEATTALILAATAIVGFEFAPITWSIVAFMTPVFAALYSALGWIFADLWDSTVSDQITCFLLNCATNDAGVVTFDYECFVGQLNTLANTLSLTESQLRLYLQITYLLYFIGGVDGLNLAGRTTAITDDDCTMCDCAGTSVNFTVSDQGFDASIGTYMTNVFGTGWYAAASGGNNQIQMSGDVASVCGNGLEIGFTLTGGAPTAPTCIITVITGTQTKNATFTPNSGSNIVTWDEGGQLVPDSGTVSISYVGASGYGAYISGFQTGQV